VTSIALDAHRPQCHEDARRAAQAVGEIAGIIQAASADLETAGLAEDAAGLVSVTHVGADGLAGLEQAAGDGASDFAGGPDDGRGHLLSSASEPPRSGRGEPE
jgi:hypothetical protein